ncbi:ORF6N domain-containing protein [Alistipes onderdonkii]
MPEPMEELTTIQSKIYEIRGQRVMLDRDLAELYGVTTGNLNKAVKRNIERFPERFMFQLTEQEFLIFQNGTSSWGGTRKRPYAFTEQGVSMLSAVLRSPTAIQVSIRIMDAFVAMRNYITTTSTITAELSEIRAKLALLERADEDNAEAVNDLSEDMRRELDNIYEAIAALSVKVPEVRKQPRPIGFKLPKEEE